MTILNPHVGPLKTQMTITQNIPNLQVCSLDERKSKGINADKRLLHICSIDESK